MAGSKAARALRRRALRLGGAKEPDAAERVRARAACAGAERPLARAPAAARGGAREARNRRRADRIRLGRPPERREGTRPVRRSARPSGARRRARRADWRRSGAGAAGSARESARPGRGTAALRRRSRGRAVAAGGLRRRRDQLAHRRPAGGPARGDRGGNAGRGFRGGRHSRRAGRGSGWLAHAGDVDGLAAALRALLGNPTEARARTREARRILASRFGVDRWLEQVDAVYARVLAGSR